MKIGFSVAVQKMAEPRNHRFKALKVNELSIVTEPAILSQEESDGGVGTVVVKSAEDHQLRLPEAVVKAFSIEDGEDVWETVKDLMNVVRMSLTTHLGDPDAYWDYHAAKVTGDSVLMTSWWDDPYSGNTRAYKCTYSRSEKTFKVDSIVEMQLALVPSEPAQKSADPTLEPTPEVAPEVTPASEPTPEATSKDQESPPADPPAPVVQDPPAPEVSVADAVKQAVAAALAEIAEKHAAEIKALQESVNATKVANEEVTTKLQQEIADTRKGLLSQSAGADAQAAAATTYEPPKKSALERANIAKAAATAPAFGLFTAPLHNTINRALTGNP